MILFSDTDMLALMVQKQTKTFTNKITIVCNGSKFKEEDLVRVDLRLW